MRHESEGPSEVTFRDIQANMGFWGFVRRFGATIAVVATWIGILYLAKDVRELPDALQAWRALVPIDRETLFIWFSGLLVIWILVRDVRPVAVPHVWGWFGWHPRSDVIAALDDRLEEGVALRNIVASGGPFDQATETAQFNDWNAAVVELLGHLSLRERSYFRTLDRFEGQHAAREIPDPERSRLEMIWNEKLRRLREIIERTDG
jgi:hypothetical protein